jgi:hypothetical protein
MHPSASMSTVLFLLCLVLHTHAFVQIAQSSDILGKCYSYSIHSDVAITFDGVASTVTGRIGVNPGVSITYANDPSPTFVIGTESHNKACSADKQIAYSTLIERGCDLEVVPETLTLSEQTLTPGNYCAKKTIAIPATSIITLDGGNDKDAVFVFRAGSALNVAASTQIVLTNGAQAKNVYWLVGTSATIGGGSNFSGQVIALAAITVATDASIKGRLFAGTAITFASNGTVKFPGCAKNIHA